MFPLAGDFGRKIMKVEYFPDIDTLLVACPVLGLTGVPVNSHGKIKD